MVSTRIAMVSIGSRASPAPYLMEVAEAVAVAVALVVERERKNRPSLLVIPTQIIGGDTHE
jgi:hypothetical protein